MTQCGEKIAVTQNPVGSTGGTESAIELRGSSSLLPAQHSKSVESNSFVNRFRGFKGDSDVFNIAGTFFTTLSVFGIYLIQGVIVARILGATGRGEFGTALYFPRDILLWAGLLGAVDIVTGYAARERCNSVLLKYSAAKLGAITGVITGLVAALLTIALLVPTGKQYLIPFGLLCCLFLPFEHMHLTISSVDRGNGSYFRYNVNRLVFALAFPVLVGLAWLVSLDQVTGISWLWLMCSLFVIAKMTGILPTLRGMHLFSPNERKQVFGKLKDGKLKNDNNYEVPGTSLLLKEGRPYAISMFVSELFERLDIFLILVIATVIESGYYFVAVPAAAMLIIAPNALGIFTFNAGAREEIRVTRSMAAKVMIATALFQIVTTIVFSMFIDDLILMFFTIEFAAAIPFALWLLPASAIKGFLQAADGYLKGIGKPWIGVYARLLSIFVMLGFAGLTFETFGLLSIPMSACVGQAVSMVIIVAGVFMNVGDDSSDQGTASVGGAI